ncbi:MAG: bifunctional 2-polyprenyl-6-hydroxyphenol methylase/3-demethylubiquinol 3-O-methyltransferase UbiG [Rhodospirillaceae bacterium]|nr:bifunctional 2-polyprenyl-6-hydroxyphenol methylase/3-demethylubiquinol 3-O-methyltransferase UbiG [Rhodospirillaceae bacterium]
MSHATSPAGSTTANAAEIAKFAAIADEWWNPQGKFKPLHKFNPERIRFVRDRAAAHFGVDPSRPEPFAGLKLLDIGCGGGLIAEPMARMGFAVTGIDAAEKNVAVARLHAERNNLPITYDCATPELLSARGRRYDVVLALEVIEHVDDIEIFLAAAGELVTPGGLLIAATLNRTLKSLALAKIGAEYVLRWLPVGTHDWRHFVRPSELAAGLRRSGLDVREISGVSYDLFKDQWKLSRDLDVNYIAMATKPAA